jgi:hypothetical protein
MLKIPKEPDVVVHICNPSTLEVEEGGLPVQGQPSQLDQILSQDRKEY